MLYFVDLPRRLFGLEFRALLFSIRESMITMATSLLAFIVMTIHFSLESVEWVRSIPLNLGYFYSEESSSEYMISESMLKITIISSLWRKLLCMIIWWRWHSCEEYRIKPYGTKWIVSSDEEVLSSEEMRERMVLRMIELSGWHITSNAMIEIHLSP